MWSDFFWFGFNALGVEYWYVYRGEISFTIQ